MADSDGYNADTLAEQREKLREFFPEVFSENKIDFEKLRDTLGDVVERDNEKYGLNWKGKSQVFTKIQEKTVSTLHPQKDESIDWDTTQNMFIEGDNLEVLKVLHKAYYGKIKMIYIDPPYNTGNDFVYNDDFAKTRREQALEEGAIDEEGNVTRDDGLRVNTGGHKHSNWLDMMYPRLFLARNLLRQDGVIFVSIDDNEVHNLRLMMNEIFGEENFIAQIIVQANKGGQDYKDLAKTHEYILCYSRSEETRLKEVEQVGVKFSLSDARGGFNIRELRNRNPKFGRFNRPNLFYPIYVNPRSDKNGHCAISLVPTDEFSVEVLPMNSLGSESCWRWGRDKVRENIGNHTAESEVVAKKKADGGWNVYEKYRKTTSKAKTIWDESSVRTEQGTIDLRELKLGGYFDHPKSVSLIKKLSTLSTSENDIILDFFSGSGTTAHAVNELNAEDGFNRTWIMVQLPEQTDEKSMAHSAGYKIITDIARERIRRASEKIRKDFAGKITKREKSIDLGFRAYVLGNSNFKKWNELVSEPNEIRQATFASLQSLENGASDDDILTEILSKRGITPLVKIEAYDGFYYVPSNDLVISLSRNMTEGLFAQILAKSPAQIILLDQAFREDVSLKTNSVLRAEKQNVNIEVL